MKFSDLNEQDWEAYKPYLDTCLLPVTGLSGREDPLVVTLELERLRDALELVEIPFKGRTVTYPACHYVREDSEAVQELVAAMRAGGFRHVIVLSARYIEQLNDCGADLVLMPEGNDNEHATMRLASATVRSAVEQLWQRAREKSGSERTTI